MVVLRDKTLSFAIGLLIALTLACVLVPLFARGDPLAIGDVLSLRLLPPFSRDTEGHWHLLGTDRFGRDLFVRMMLAGRISLAVGVMGSVIAATLGTLAGAVAAWRGGWIDRVLMGLADALLSIPRLVLLLVCAALWQPGLTTVVIVLVAKIGRASCRERAKIWVAGRRFEDEKRQTEREDRQS